MSPVEAFSLVVVFVVILMLLLIVNHLEPIVRAKRIVVIQECYKQLEGYRKGAPITAETISCIQRAGSALASIIDAEVPKLDTYLRDVDIAKRRKVTREVLAEVRRMGGTYRAVMGNGVEGDLKESAKNFPASWITASNNRLALTVMQGDTPHYADGCPVSVEAPPPFPGFRATANPVADAMGLPVVTARPKSNEHVVAMSTIPRGERAKFVNVKLHYATNPDSIRGDKTPVFIDSPCLAYDAERQGALTHALAHHAEKTLPHILKAEAVFYAQRTRGNEPYRFREHFGIVGECYLHDGRYYRDGGWVDRQVGRDHSYEKGVERPVAYDILTIGMEAVFYGAYGGLCGSGDYKPDRHHRVFVLGLLATA